MCATIRQPQRMRRSKGELKSIQTKPMNVSISSIKQLNTRQTMIVSAANIRSTAGLMRAMIQR